MLKKRRGLMEMESIIQKAIERQMNREVPYVYETEKEEEFLMPQEARIAVLGIGGMGCNAINRLSTIGIIGAETIAMNTDAKHLKMIKADRKILLGQEITRGLGAGGYPEVGRRAAEESINEIKEALRGMDMVFVVAGMGGGTGTGAAPIAAEVAKQQGAIVIGVVTMPFRIEGARIHKAEEGLINLRRVTDTVIVIENDRLLEIAGEMSLDQAFAVADEIIVTMIKGITETISTPSLVNLDFADVKAVMSVGGVAMIGIGESSSASRAREAVEKALENPLLDVDYTGANGALIHITGGKDLKLSEINEIGMYVQKHLDANAQTIWGARIDSSMDGKIRVITIITGVKSPYVLGPSEAAEELEKKSLGEALGIEIIK